MGARGRPTATFGSGNTGSAHSTAGYDFGEHFRYVVLPDGDFIVQDASFDAIDREVEAGSLKVS